MSKTLATLISEIQDDLNIVDAEWISTAQITKNINRAIKDAEAIIHNLYEDYFLDHAYLTLTSGGTLFDLPTNIYAQKIRQIMYNNGSEYYRIYRIRDLNLITRFQASDNYQYLLENDATSGMQIHLYPASREASATNVTITYLRQAKQLALTTDTLDIPEFSNYVIANAEARCLRKEPFNPMLPDLKEELVKQHGLMVQSLSNRQPDDQTSLQADYSFYYDSQGSYGDYYDYN